MAILLPATFGSTPVAGIIMLAGIYYGAMYGGTITSVLVNIPGEAASCITCLDGYQMARRGRAGPALGISAFGSFIGGTFSIIALTFTVFILSEVALMFGPPEYFGLMCMGLTIIVYLVKGSLMKAIMMALVGLFLGCVGTDVITGTLRFTLGLPELYDGVGIAPVAMGLFGVSEVLRNIEKTELQSITVPTKVKNILPNREDWKKSAGPIGRGSVLGFLLGILPGGGAILSSFVSYSLEKRLSKHPERFGRGAIEGVAGPETANNAATGGAFIPLLALGIPPNVIMALLLGAFLVHGITPGPLLMKQHPDVFFGTIASMYVGNGLLLILNIPLIGLWIKVLKIPPRILYPLIFLFTLIGVYSVRNMVFDIYIMLFFGVVGYVLKKYEYEEAPILLGFILGPILEQAFRQSLVMSYGDLTIFITRPIAATTIALSIALLGSTLFGIFKNARRQVVEKLDDE
ncbi:hypothetical protein FAK_39690 [Desulfoferula mesophila]|uniref:DUF112 domain-containing protein n=2 Tax=Desulfoferula mesophila TaxID=3058419 RepID=A0AAU9F351_9BACT|nr:hypothetical protein FAK_39690 [Desulfoferula mesophilus]